MKSNVPKSLDDILFESRNKEYGSYKLRKQYFLRLALSFLISLASMVLLVLCYYWYLNSAGDEAIYFYSSSNPIIKSTQGSFLSPRELNSYMSNPISPEEKKFDKTIKKNTDVLHNFTIAENPTTDTFKPSLETDLQPEYGIGLESSADSVVFGGFLPGDGEGGGGENEIDRFPVFPGGSVQRYIESVLNYPPQAIKQKIHGRVLLSFVVNKTGEVVNIKIEKSANPLLDAEAMKAIRSLPPWKPGLRHGRPISIQLLIPVNFMPLN